MPSKVPSVKLERSKLDLQKALLYAAELHKALDRLFIHANEFSKDWRKGDFALPKLAECDMESMESIFPQVVRALRKSAPKLEVPDEVP